MLPRKHVIKVWYNQHNRYEATCSCQWGAVTLIGSRLDWFIQGHKGHWVLRGDEVVMEGQDDESTRRVGGFEESLRKAIEAVTPEPEPTPAPEAGAGTESVAAQVKKADKIKASLKRLP